MLLFKCKEIYLTDSQIVDCMCIWKCTYFFIIKNRVNLEVFTLFDLCMITISLGLLAYLEFDEIVEKVQV